MPEYQIISPIGIKVCIIKASEIIWSENYIDIYTANHTFLTKLSPDWAVIQIDAIVIED